MNRNTLSYINSVCIVFNHICVHCNFLLNGCIKLGINISYLRFFPLPHLYLFANVWKDFLVSDWPISMGKLGKTPYGSWTEAIRSPVISTDGYSVLYSVNWIFANRKYACPWMTFHSRTWISQAYSNCFSEIEGDRVSMDDNEWGKYAFSFSLLSFPYLTTEFHLFWVASTIISLFNSSFS